MARRITIALLAAALLLIGACGDDTNDGITGPDSPTADVDTGGDNAAPDDAATPTGGGDGSVSVSGPSGRLDLGDDGYNFYLGDMTTAMCTVNGDDDVLIQDMRSSDDSSISVVVGAGMTEITLRGPDGNRSWVTGDQGEAEGVDFDLMTTDNIFSVNGTWVDVTDPSVTEEGRLVITC